MNKRKINLILLGIILTTLMFVGSYILYQSWTPCLLETLKQDIFWVNIQGKVLTDNDALDLYTTDKESYEKKRPSKIGLYAYNPLEKMGIPRGGIVAGSDINWTNDTVGTYEVSFRTAYPIYVVITAYTDYSNYSLVDLKISNPKRKVNVYWGLSSLKVEKQKAFEDPEKELRVARRRLDVISQREFPEIPPDNLEHRQIKEDIGNAGDYLRSAEDAPDNSTKLMDALYGHWYAERAQYHITLYKLKTSIEEANKTLGMYDDSTCYLLPYDSVLKINESIKIYESSKDYYDRDNPQDYDFQKRDELIREINGLYSKGNKEGYNAYGSLQKCNIALKTLNETFAFQSQYCQKRRDAIFLFKWTLLILLIAIVFLLSIFLEAHLKITEKINKELSKVEESWDKLEPILKALLFAFPISIVVLMILFFVLWMLFGRYIEQVYVFSLAGLFTLAIFKYLVDHKKEQYQKDIKK